ncbi:MAG: cobalt ECF transporter T component CbiQ [Proteobacteria bacterium]|nr:cobalt ECF transporter T component CbiQ [Pseudomonadota bacterium]
MAKIESAFFDLSYLEALAGGNTIVHRLDPRVKVLTVALFMLAVVSFDKYIISAMLPFGLFLVIIMGLADIPAEYLGKKLLLVSPFAVMVGIFNPFLDQQPLLQIGTFTVTGGWLSFLSILLRFTLTVSAVLILIATTGFNAVCMAMVKMGMPKIFAVQLLILYRYIFVLIDEGLSMYRARSMRSFQRRAMSLKTFAHLVGQLLLRTLDRAQRIHLAMLCRGFDGTLRIRQVLRITASDLFVLTSCATLFFLMRSYDLPEMLGRFVTGLSL